MTYKIDDLKFLLKEKLDPVVCFYGGEPLVRWEKMTQIMDLLGDRPTYVLQSNCQFLDQVPDKYIQRFDTILCSIDGDEATTDVNRGEGVYKKCIKNCIDARKRG